MPEDYNLSLTAADDIIDIDKVDTDPAEAAKLKHRMETERYRRNIMTLDEFETKFSNLFSKDKALNMNPDSLKKLSQEYLGRIDPYFPVYVIRAFDSPMVSQLLKEDNVVYTLPPMYNRTGVVNNLGRDGINIMQAFNNIVASNMDDRFNKKKDLYSKSLAVVLDRMKDDSHKDELKAKVEEMGKRVIQRSHETVQADGTVSGRDVQDIPEDMLTEIGVSVDVTNSKQEIEEEEFL